MDSIEAVVAHIQALSSKPQEIPHLLSLLKQTDDSLHSQSSRLAPFFERLDPAKHSLGYLYLLEAYSGGPILREQASGFLANVVSFINSCSEEQIRLAPDKFISVCKRFKDQVVQLQAPIQGVAPLRTAIRKLQPSSEHLTTLHADFLLLSILSKCYKAAQSILDEDIFEVDQPRDLFLYFYYGGMINIGLKRYDKALECLHNVITAPMTSLNAIAVEAYKKYILVSLIHNGQVPSFPKYTSSSAQRNLKNYTQPYVDLLSSYASGKFSELEIAIQANMEKFQSDNNLGLVKQVLSSLYKRNIQRLTQTYLTLSLQDIATIVQLNSAKEAEMHVLRMIQDGEIFATINQKDGMVSFHEDPEPYKTCEMIEHIDSSIQRLMTLSKKLSAIDEHISCDPAYVTKARHLHEHRRDLGLVEPKLAVWHHFMRRRVLRLIGVALLCSCTQVTRMPLPHMSQLVAMLTVDGEVAEVTTRPGYLMEWQVKGLSSNFISTDLSKASTSGPTYSQDPGTSDTSAVVYPRGSTSPFQQFVIP